LYVVCFFKDSTLQTPTTLSIEERRVQESIDRLDRQLRGIFFYLFKHRESVYFIQKFKQEIDLIPVQDYKSKNDYFIDFFHKIFSFIFRNQKR